MSDVGFLLGSLLERMMIAFSTFYARLQQILHRTTRIFLWWLSFLTIVLRVKNTYVIYAFNTERLVDGLLW